MMRSYMTIAKFGDRRLSEQFAFFAKMPATPEELRYSDEFVSPSSEMELIERFGQLPLAPFQFGQYEGRRRVASFGFSYDYALRKLKHADPIPSWLTSLVQRVEAFGGPDTKISQVLFTEYPAGVGVGWHRDKPHFDRIFGLSLGSSCKFRFRRPSGDKWDRFTLEAAPRSIYMMSGESRRVWEHSIPDVEAPRFSITFRTLAERKL